MFILIYFTIFYVYSVDHSFLISRKRSIALEILAKLKVAIFAEILFVESIFGYCRPHSQKCFPEINKKHVLLTKSATIFKENIEKKNTKIYPPKCNIHDVFNNNGKLRKISSTKNFLPLSCYQYIFCPKT